VADRGAGQRVMRMAGLTGPGRKPWGAPDEREESGHVDVARISAPGEDNGPALTEGRRQ